MNLKAHVPGHQDHTIGTEAERGEHAAISAYGDALSGILPPPVLSVVEAQLDKLRAAQGRIQAFDPV